MVKFELKKIFSSVSGKIALALLAMMVLLAAWLAVSGVEWINEQGDPETGLAAISKLRAAQKVHTNGLIFHIKCHRIRIFRHERTPGIYF